MKKHGVIFAGDISDETKLYRYLTLSQFISFVELKQTYLTQIKLWDDTWEAPLRKVPVQHDDGTLKVPLYHIANDLFGQCWSLNGQSDALWRIYSTQKEGLLIQTTAKKFKEIQSIKFGLLAPVIYYSNLKEGFETLESKVDYHSPFKDAFIKRKAFEHEDEVRLVTLNDERCIGQNYKNCTHIYVDLDPMTFLEGITIDPRAAEWYVESIQLYCKRVGFNFKPIKSDLYSTDIFKSSRLVTKWVPVDK